MDYRILPIGDVWNEGMFSVPSKIANKYIRLASAYQLQALLVVLSSGGKCSSRDISMAIGVPESEVCDLLAFWVEEGVLLEDGTAPAAQPQPENKEAKPAPAAKEQKAEEMPAPVLTTTDVTAMLRDDESLNELMLHAEELLGRTLSAVEKEMIVNMAVYYGLPHQIVLTILQYYKSEKEKGQAIGVAYIAAMAKNWSEEGITTLDAAEEKLKAIEESDHVWKEIIDLSGIRHRRPTAKQREMIKNWRADFNMEMIGLACEAMRENAEHPSLKYVDSVLKSWKKKGIKTPDDVAKDNEKHESEKANKKEKGKLEGKPSFDIDKIQNKIFNNDNFDV